jgi:hypothetical protein
MTASFAASDRSFRDWRLTHPWRRAKALPLVAARDGRADIVRRFVLEKTDCHAALLRAVCENDARALATLIKGGVDVNATYKNKNALGMAAEYCAADCVALLLKHGADPDLRGRDKWTALMWAAFHNDTATLQHLSAAGADPTLRDNHSPRRTALDIAREDRRSEAAMWLTSYSILWTAKRRAALGLDPILRPAAALPAPPEAPALPPGWSVITEGGAQMAIQRVSDAASRTEIRNVFDFKGRRLLTEFRGANGAPSLSERPFGAVEAALVEEARAIFAAATARPAAAPGLI